MAIPNSEQGFLPSILDRLTDPDSGGTAWRTGYGFEQMRASVQHDLEDLLNTRRSDVGINEEFEEVRKSLIGYGLPDLSALKAETLQQREEVGREIEASIGRFEPRLRDVKVTVLAPESDKDRSIRFRLEARLNVDPAPEVAYDTVLELSTGRYSVQTASHE